MKLQFEDDQARVAYAMLRENKISPALAGRITPEILEIWSPMVREWLAVNADRDLFPEDTQELLFETLMSISPRHFLYLMNKETEK
jgi:hypothetical protein